MKAFFQDIFEYHHYFNQKVASLLIAHIDGITERSIPLFSHIINAHHIWNSRVLGRKPLMKVWDVHTLEACKAFDFENFENTMKILQDADLTQRISYKTSRGDVFENTTQEILFHVANHTTHHRGQIISDLRQNDIEPIATDYIFYKR